jgi:Phage P22-like portal protein
MPRIPRKQDQPATTDDAIFQECAERLKIAIEAEGENRLRGIEALEFRDGQQWPDDLYNQRRIDKRPSLTINHTNTFVRRVVNNMRQQRPRIKVHPVGDGANVDKANVLSGLIRHIETASSAAVAYDTGGESAVCIGWGYWRVLSEYLDESSFEQELKVAAIRNPFTVYFDPSSAMPAGEDAEWCIITEKMKREEYARQYPDAENIEFQRSGNGDSFSEWESKTEIRLAEYYRIQRTTETLYRMSNGMALFADDIKKLSAELDAAQVTKTGESRPSFRQRVEWFKLNGTKIVDRRSADSNPLPDKWIPIVRCEGNVLDLNGRIRRKGMVADLMDPARMYNYWRTMETEMLALAPKAPWIVAAGQTDGHPEWKDANQKPYSALTWEPVTVEQPDGSKTLIPPPQRTPPVPIPAGAVQAAQGAVQDLMAVAGMPHEPMNDTPGSVVSGVALERRQALSDIGHFQYYDNQTRAIAHTGRILVQLIPHYYSTARMQRIIGEDGVPSMVPINQQQPSAANAAVMEVKNDLTVGRYDVVMDTGPGYETKRLEGAEAMLDLLKTPLAEPIAKVGADLIVRNLDFAGSSDLADRLMPMNPQGMEKLMQNLPKDAQGVVQAMYQQMQATQAELQQTKLELKYKTGIELGWMNVEREKNKTQSDTKVHDTEIRSRTAMHDTVVKGETAVRVAEIGAGAQLLNTHAEAAHDRAAAREMAENAAKAEKGANGAG